MAIIAVGLVDASSGNPAKPSTNATIHVVRRKVAATIKEVRHSSDHHTLSVSFHVMFCSSIFPPASAANVAHSGDGVAGSQEWLVRGPYDRLSIPLPVQIKRLHCGQIRNVSSFLSRRIAPPHPEHDGRLPNIPVTNGNPPAKKNSTTKRMASIPLESTIPANDAAMTAAQGMPIARPRRTLRSKPH